MDETELNRLREAYGGVGGGEVRDPAFRRVAERIFSKSGTRTAPYAGVPTLLGAPLRPIDWSVPDLSGLQVALMGVPMDLGVTNRAAPASARGRCAASSASAPTTTC